jgi:formate dehydrogenase gamma subunit
MKDVERGGHAAIGEEFAEVINCASCHDVHGTHKPHMSSRVADACVTCHTNEMAAFAGSVHEDLFEADVMSCLSCHSTHKDEEEVGRFDAGCGACHEDIEEVYRSSVHRMGRLRGDEAAATCADCHEGHHVLAESDTTSAINFRNIPYLCGECHGADAVVTSEYVRLPISLPNYLKSVHGVGWKEGKKTAVCTDCHGTHDLTTTHDPDSRINTFNIANTCGECHEEIAEEYHGSVHGKALEFGILDSPTCTTCHSEHLIKAHDDPDARISVEHRARELCGDCHSRPDLIAKYGLTGGVVESYLDTYHGWAIAHGNGLVASCTDCHTTHSIRAQADPESSIHPENVTETCGTCHAGSNPTFAQSYTHAGALAARGYHDWARLIYIFLISFVLGGMGLHNLLIARYELRKHFKKRNKEPFIMRWGSAERVQHIVLIISFFGLAITGFALRFPDSWWVNVLGLGGKEFVRMNIHRALAIVMIVVSVYHMIWVVVARRGRIALKEMVPRGSDLVHAIQNMLFYLKIKKERPQFNAYDYTQKAEYWALVWGTWVMVVTGFILWFPTVATNYMPAWVVRVAEVVHFYEAILAVAAIVIWHWFFVIFLPHEFPMSTIWINGKMPAEEWKKNHRGDYLKVGDSAIIDPTRTPDDYVETDSSIPGVTEELGPTEPKDASKKV